MYLLNEIKEIFMYLFDIFVICLYLCIYRAWAGGRAARAAARADGGAMSRHVLFMSFSCPQPCCDTPSEKSTIFYYCTNSAVPYVFYVFEFWASSKSP